MTRKKIHGIIGVTNMSVEHRVGEAVNVQIGLVAERGYDLRHLMNEEWGDIFPGNVIVKCEHCRQYAARKTACVHCGAPVD